MRSESSFEKREAMDARASLKGARDGAGMHTAIVKSLERRVEDLSTLTPWLDSDGEKVNRNVATAAATTTTMIIIII